jgi:tripartite-type tricarboxylate transporter receptor subunit TctC
MQVFKKLALVKLALVKPALILAAAVASAGAITLPARAADFPSGPVRIVHGYPGGLIDVAARVLADSLATVWKQPVVVDAKPGGNELIAGDFVAKSAGDGQTLYIGTESTFANNPNLYAKMPFDPAVDLLPVTELFELHFGLVVRADLPVQNLSEFVALMKKDGAKYAYASSGVGGPLHLAMEDFRRTAGFEMTHVPYKVLPQVMQDLMGGRIDAVFLSAGTVLPFVASGKLKMLAVTGPARLKSAPAIPTFAELGHASVNYKTSVGMAAPKGTPAAVIQKIQSDVKAVLWSKAYIDRVLAASDIDPVGNEPAQFGAQNATRRAAAQRLIKSLNIQLE